MPSDPRIQQALDAIAEPIEGFRSTLANTSEQIRLLLSEKRLFVPDALKFPPGYIVDLESDENLGLVYVLGRGELPRRDQRRRLRPRRGPADLHHDQRRVLPRQSTGSQPQ